MKKALALTLEVLTEIRNGKIKLVILLLNLEILHLVIQKMANYLFHYVIKKMQKKVLLKDQLY